MGSFMSPKIASFVKYAAMTLFIFIGLSEIDQKDKIVPIAFQAFVYASAAAATIAFGLGGRDWAAKVLNKAVPPADVEKTTGGSKPATRRAPPPKK